MDARTFTFLICGVKYVVYQTCRVALARSFFSAPRRAALNALCQ